MLFHGIIILWNIIWDLVTISYIFQGSDTKILRYGFYDDGLMVVTGA